MYNAATTVGVEALDVLLTQNLTSPLCGHLVSPEAVPQGALPAGFPLEACSEYPECLDAAAGPWHSCEKVRSVLPSPYVARKDSKGRRGHGAGDTGVQGPNVPWRKCMSLTAPQPNSQVGVLGPRPGAPALLL